MTAFNLADPSVVLSLIFPFAFVLVMYYILKTKRLDVPLRNFAKAYPTLWVFTLFAVMLIFIFSLINVFSIIFWYWNI